MKAGCVPYRIEAEVEGVNVPPDLNHLERMLNKIGYTCKTPLRKLQDGSETFSQIEPSSFRASHVRNNDGIFELVVFYSDEALEQFAKEYTPLPISSDVTH